LNEEFASETKRHKKILVTRKCATFTVSDVSGHFKKGLSGQFFYKEARKTLCARISQGFSKLSIFPVGSKTLKTAL
jgi:hypothetical protein